MGMIGAQEILIILIAATAVIAAYVLAIRKIIRSKMTANQKIGWSIVIVLFNFPGLVAFLIYHDILLAPELRGEL